MANIVTIKDVASIPGVNIIMDSRKECAIIVEYNNNILKFQKCRDGFYYYDTANKFISHVNSYSFLSTVKDKNESFSTSEIQGADKVRKVQQEIGWPSTSHFKDVVSKPLLCNYEVTVGDISRAEVIYGSLTPIL